MKILKSKIKVEKNKKIKTRTFKSLEGPDALGHFVVMVNQSPNK